VTADKIVDASALAAIAFIEPRAAAMAARLRGHRLLAPALLRFELAHVCIKKMRERPAESALILGQFESSLQVPVQIMPIDHRKAIGLAEQFSLSAYDASYLWLARELGLDLVTGDAALEKAFARAQRVP
jgi:predicted nucleic acid-binding protein